MPHPVCIDLKKICTKRCIMHLLILIKIRSKSRYVYFTTKTASLLKIKNNTKVIKIDSLPTLPRTNFSTCTHKPTSKYLQFTNKNK